MSKIRVISACMAFFLMFSFIMVGYANLTDNIRIWGEAEVDTPEGLFITDISDPTSRSGLDVYTTDFADFSTMVTVDLSKSADRTAGSVTYTITVLNNTKYYYAYRDIFYQTSTEKNSYIVTEQTKNPTNKINITTDFFEGTVVPPGEYLHFNVTYNIGSDRNTFRARDTFTTIVNYRFGLNVDSEAAAIDAISAKFANILNTTTTYLQLVDVLDNKFDGRQEWTSNYVGNVGDADSDDAMVVNTLFAGQLFMYINGEEKPATVLIKHENLDNNTKTGDDYTAINTSNNGVFRGYGCEMTLYLTTDSLTPGNRDAEVYVCVFTCNRDDEGNIVGDWYRIGDTYKGIAPVVGYNGESGGTGSFVTDNWVSTKASYQTTRNYRYDVEAGQTIKTLTQIYDQRAITAFQELLNDAKYMIEDARYAGIGIHIVENAYNKASSYFTIDANGNPVANPDTLRVWLCPDMRNLDEVLMKAQEEIDKIE